jgi:hypothetical protein
MININIQGRLGNQMFQYAFARAVQKQMNGEQINICFGEDGNLLQDFCVKDFIVLDNFQLNFIQKVVIKFFLLIRRIKKITYKNRIAEHRIEIKYQKTLNFFGIYWLTQGYYDFSIKETKNTMLIGYFESSKYFSEITKQIKSEFVPKYDKLSSNYDLYKKIETSESVCLAIRRGDYIEDDYVKKVAYVCSEDYYYKAIKKIKELVTKPVFFIFSNDIEWVKEKIELNTGIEVYYEDKNNPAWETMRLMYNCKHFIISNSTFHWWAQYLSRNENKIVIAPNRWRNYECELAIYEPDWILIEP